MKRTYLAGPMSGHLDLNFPAFHAEAARLRALGYTVVNPAELNPDPAMDWAEALAADFIHLEHCDSIALLPDWEKSRGANREYGYALGRGFTVVMAADLVERKE